MQAWINHRFTTTSFISLTLSIVVLGLTACEPGIKKPGQPSLDSFNGLEILSIDPAPGATNARLDQEVTLVLSQRVDAYSAHPSNFQIVTDSGSILPSKLLPKTKFVPDPRDPNNTVSQIGIIPGQFLSPNRRYYVLWRDGYVQAEDEQPNQNNDLIGIRSLRGDYLTQGMTYFNTGNDFSPFRKNHLELLSMSPGKILNRADNPTHDGDFGGIVNQYVSVNKRAPIVFSFSEGVRCELGGDAPPYTNNIRPQSTATNNPNRLRCLMVGVVDSQTQLSTFMSAAASLGNDPAALENFLNDHLRQRVQGVTYTQSAQGRSGASPRQLLVFEPTEDYPDTLAQAVVVIVTGLHGTSTLKPLDPGMVVGTFAHYSGFQFAAGFPTIKGILNDLLGGGGTPP